MEEDGVQDLVECNLWPLSHVWSAACVRTWSVLGTQPRPLHDGFPSPFHPAVAEGGCGKDRVACETDAIYFLALSRKGVLTTRLVGTL